MSLLEHNTANSASPLNAEQAQQLLQSVRLLKPGAVIAAQCLATLLIALLAAVVADRAAAASALYGGVCIVLPNLALLHGLRRGLARVNALGGFMAFFVWEGVKLAIAVTLLVLAPRMAQFWGGDLRWIWLLLGVLVAAKSVWLAFMWSRRR